MASQGRWQGPDLRRPPPPALASPTCPCGVLLTSPVPPSVTSPPLLPATAHRETERTQTRSGTESRRCVGCRSGRAQPDGFPLFGLFEELSTAPPGPLASGVVKSGYLGKRRRNCRRYFVLRRASRARPSCLVWYKTEKKFREAERSAGEDEPLGPDRAIYLPHCLGVSKLAGSRHGHMVALYAKDLSLSLVAEDQGEQDEWYAAIKKLMAEEEKGTGEGERMDGVNEGEVLNDEDEGYLTYPPASVFKEVWSVTVKPRGLGRTKSLAGESHLCLSATSLLLVRVGPGGTSPAVRTSLLSVRRCGHRDGLFFLELGRSAPYGPGEIWMEAGDRGDQVLAQSMHETVLETMRALRAPPDWSPTSDHSWQSRPAPRLSSKLSAPKCREKAGHVRRVAPPSSTPPKLPSTFMSLSSPTLRHLEHRSPDGMDRESSFGSSSDFTPSLCLSPVASILSTGSIPSLRSVPSPRSLPFRSPDPSSNDWSSAARPPGLLGPLAGCCPDAEASRWDEEVACRPRDPWGSGAETGSHLETMDRKDGDGVSTAMGDRNTIATGDRHSIVMEMKDNCTVAARRPGEGEGPDYMTMSPQGASGLAAPWDDYVNMTSPHMHTWPPAAPPSSSCPLQMLFNRPAACDDSALLNHGTDQSDNWRPNTFTVSLLSMDQHVQEQEVLSHLMSTTCPLETNSEYSQATLVYMPGLGRSRPPRSSSVQTAPDRSNPVRAASVQCGPVQSVFRRHWLSSCLPSCLQAKGKD